MVGPTEVTLDDVADVIIAPGPNDHKYTRGVVALAAGSNDYPGAAVLAAQAAVHTGVGMVRMIAPAGVNSLVLASRPEVVTTAGKTDALVIGCGMSRGSRFDVLDRLGRCDLPHGAPRVIDAGALANTPEVGGPAIVTPHGGEMNHLATTLGLAGATPQEHAAALCDRWGVVVLLKGHRPTVFSPDGEVYQLPPGTAWLASAGTGDVLAGILGALLAMRRVSQWTPAQLSLTACAGGLVHQEAAARVSARSPGGGPVVALELAREVSAVIPQIVAST